MADKVQTMAYFGETPWHGKGKAVDHAMTSAEAIEFAGLNWDVAKVPLYLANGVQAPGAWATQRGDTGATLGIVGDQYEVLQNRDAFQIADAIVGEKAAMYHTAGALSDGKRVWMLLKMPGVIRTIGDDVTEKYLLVANGHDGSFAVHVMMTPVRVVCNNTLNAALGIEFGKQSKKMPNKLTLRHTASLSDKLQVRQVREVLGLAAKHFDLFEQLSQKLVATKFDKANLKKFAQATGVIPTEKKEGDSLSTRAQNIMDEISALFETGKGTEIPGVKGTAWAAYNAITEFVDHSRGADADARANSLLYGSGARIKQAAFDQAVELIGARQ